MKPFDFFKQRENEFGKDSNPPGIQEQAVEIARGLQTHTPHVLVRYTPHPRQDIFVPRAQLEGNKLLRFAWARNEDAPISLPPDNYFWVITTMRENDPKIYAYNLFYYPHNSNKLRYSTWEEDFDRTQKNRFVIAPQEPDKIPTDPHIPVEALPDILNAVRDYANYTFTRVDFIQTYFPPRPPKDAKKDNSQIDLAQKRLGWATAGLKV